MIDHALAERPNESVGLMATVPADEGGAELVTGYLPGRNLDASPVRYTMHPADVRAALAAVRSAGARLGGIVHSHPRDPAVPSATDLAEARLPAALMVIVSLAAGPPTVRAWRLAAGSEGGAAVAEVAIVVTGQSMGTGGRMASIEEMRQ